MKADRTYLFSPIYFRSEGESNVTHHKSVVELRRQRIRLSGICAVGFLVWVCFVLVFPSFVVSGVLLLLCFVSGVFGFLFFKFTGFQGSWKGLRGRSCRNLTRATWY